MVSGKMKSSLLCETATQELNGEFEIFQAKVNGLCTGSVTTSCEQTGQ